MEKNIKIKFTSKEPVIVNNPKNQDIIIGYFNYGDEYILYPTYDGIKFNAFGFSFSPYDFIGFCELKD